jgi:hypothetical protein
MKIGKPALALGALTACTLVLTVVLAGSGSKLEAQIRQMHWQATKPAMVVETLLGADKMAPMTVAAFDGKLDSRPKTMKLAANQSKFAGIAFSDGTKLKAKPAKAGVKGNKKTNLLPGFKAKKTDRGLKLRAKDGAKFKTSRGAKSEIKMGPKIKARKAKGRSDKWSLKKVDRKTNKNAKMVFPASKLNKMKSQVKRAKSKGTGKAVKSFPGSVNAKPALFTKKVGIERGTAQKVRVTKTMH